MHWLTYVQRHQGVVLRDAGHVLPPTPAISSDGEILYIDGCQDWNVYAIDAASGA